MSTRPASRSDARSIPPAAFVSLVGVMVVAVATVAFTAPATAPPPPAPSPVTHGAAAVTTVDEPVGPSGRDHGVGVGWRHDYVGAESAAATFVEASRLVATTGPLYRRDVLLAMATPGYGPVLVESTNRQLDDLLFAFADRGARGELVWDEHALTVDRTDHSIDAVDVTVWSVLVVGATGGSLARQVWRTSTLEMRWVNGDWKVDRWSTRPGPAPAPPPEATASSVAEVASVAAWRPARPAGAL